MFVNWRLHHLRICKASLRMLDRLRLAKGEAKDCSAGTCLGHSTRLKSERTEPLCFRCLCPVGTVGGRNGAVCMNDPIPCESAQQHCQSRSFQCQGLINVYADHIEGKNASGNVKMDNPDSKRNPENSSKYAIL